MKKEWTGERLETHIQTRDTVDHLHRYAIALNYVEGKTVLDIASGEGYGSNLLCKSAKFVYGVDIDEMTVREAQQKYQAENLEYRVGSTDAIPLESGTVDVVISFETIEHHDKHEEMLLEIKRILKPDGVLIISTPDKYFYSDKRNFKNKFHIKELYKNEFVELISSYFKENQVLNQIFSHGNSMIIDDQKALDLELVTGDFSAIMSIEKEATYLIMISSDANFKSQGLSVFEGSGIVKMRDNKVAEHFLNSSTYKIGNAVLAPFKFIKKLIK